MRATSKRRADARRAARDRLRLTFTFKNCDVEYSPYRTLRESRGVVSGVNRTPKAILESPTHHRYSRAGDKT